MSSKKDNFTLQDKKFMQLALKLASVRKGLTGENPSVGCLIVKNDQIISIGQTGLNGRPHAEHNAIKNSVENVKGSKMYVTLEPCLMCFGACIHARIDRLIFATEDPKSGVVINNLNLKEEEFFNHKISVSSGILAQESSELLKKFFQERRN